MNWSSQRKFLYAFAVIIFILACGVYLARGFLFKEPTCNDGIKNGFEIGVDCGGTCALKCVQEISPLSVKWSRAVKTSSSTYDLVAMISNKNIDNASRYFTYIFTVYDEQGGVLGVFNGTTTAPIDGDFPLVMQNIHVPREAVSVTTDINDQLHYAVASKPTSFPLKVSNVLYEGDRDASRVYASISNTKRVTFLNIPVRVVLFDVQDNAFAVGETVVPFLDKEETKVLSFVWPYQLPQKPSKTRVYPILNPFVPSQ
jgi:hypothetical protein